MVQGIGWKLISIMALAAALIGIPVPGWPTVPFLLVAAWAGHRGWPELEQRLLAHPRAGPAIRDWRQRRAVPRRAKRSAALLMALSVLIVWLTLRNPLFTVLLAALLTAVALWLWSRPDA
jgi:uncharacterized membrane protein YbaN (DUF454 family)